MDDAMKVMAEEESDLADVQGSILQSSISAESFFG
jgi:hypothetical protein